MFLFVAYFLFVFLQQKDKNKIAVFFSKTLFWYPHNLQQKLFWHPYTLFLMLNDQKTLQVIDF